MSRNYSKSSGALTPSTERAKPTNANNSEAPASAPELNKKKSNRKDITTKSMVNKKDMTEIAKDMVGYVLTNSIRGEKTEMASAGRMLIADTLYEYVFDALLEGAFSNMQGGSDKNKAMSSIYTPEITKVVGLTVVHATVRNLTGMSGFTQDHLWDSLLSSGGIVLTTTIIDKYGPNLPAN